MAVYLHRQDLCCNRQ